jgi:23S rRNA (uracil1939-C5)-methyltransferase
VECVSITGIAAGGAGVGRLRDGRTVFVHRTAPGDNAEIAVIEERSRWAKARLVRVVRPGPDRRHAPCPLYRRCGGCTLQHIAPEAQHRAKSQLVADAFNRIGHIALDPPALEAGSQEFRYRNRLSFTLLRLRGRVVAGFHEIARPDRVLDIDARCLLPETAVGMAWAQLREAWGPQASRLPSGSRLRLTLRAVENGDVSLAIEGGDGEGDAVAVLAGAPAIVSIWHLASPASEPVLLAGRDVLAETWLGESLQLSGTTFLQVNREAAALLERHVLALAGDVSNTAVVDAYCGVGSRARALAARGAVVTGIELDVHAVREARRLGGGPTYLEGRVEESLAATLPADSVLLNPPRTGVAPDVCAALLARPPARILYVSCDPATLARDVARLAGRFAVGDVRSFDLFPQTAHVETVAALACVTT